MVAITGISPTVSTSDTSSLTPFANATLSDPGGSTYYVLDVVQQQAGNGILIGPSASGGFVSNDGLLFELGYNPGVTPAQNLAADQAALRSLLFQPNAAQVAPGQSVATGLSVELNAVNRGPLAASAVTNVVATAAANPLAVQAPPPATFQPVASVLPFAGFKISDGRPGVQDTAAITLTVNGTPTDAAGTLSGGGLSKTATGTYALAAASPAAAQTALQGVQFNATSPASIPLVGFGVSVSDGAGPPASAHTTLSFLAITAAGGAETVTGSIAASVTTTTTTVTATAQAYSTTIDAMIGSNTVYAQTLALPYSDPAVQAAIAQADAAVIAAGAAPGTPSLSASGTTSSTATATTPTALTIAPNPAVTTTETFGPTILMNGGNGGDPSLEAVLGDYTFVSGGVLDINVNTAIRFTNDQIATTTTTDTLAQTYTITGAPDGGNPPNPPGTSVPEPASAAVMWVALAGSVIARGRTRLSPRRRRRAGGRAG